MKCEENLFVSQPRQYDWKPKSDITAYELALIIPIFACRDFDVELAISKLPEQARRHFEEVNISRVN